MSVREVDLLCPECGERVAWGKQTDDGTVWEIGLSKSVLMATLLHIGMGIAFFVKARQSVQCTNNGAEHSIC